MSAKMAGHEAFGAAHLVLGLPHDGAAGALRHFVGERLAHGDHGLRQDLGIGRPEGADREGDDCSTARRRRAP